MTTEVPKHKIYECIISPVSYVVVVCSLGLCGKNIHCMCL